MAELRVGSDQLPEQVQDHPRLGRPVQQGQGTHQQCRCYEVVALLQGRRPPYDRELKVNPYKFYITT